MHAHQSQFPGGWEKGWPKAKIPGVAVKLAECAIGPVRFLPGPDQGRYPHSHSLYIPGDKILIDTGADREKLRDLRDREGVRQVWLSHWHRDHIRNLDLFERVPLYMAWRDAPPLACLETFINWSGVFGNSYRAQWREEMKHLFHFRPRRPQGYLHGGQTINLRDGQVRVVAAPGHTPGSLCFLFNPGGVLFLADYDFSPLGPWYGDPFSNIEEIISTVQNLSRLPASLWVISHGRGIIRSEPGDLWQRYISVFEERDQKLLRRLESPCSMHEIVDSWIAFQEPREPAHFYRSVESALMKKHLQGLQSRGLVKREGERFMRL